MSAPSSSVIRVVIADDHQLFRESLSKLLQADPMIVVERIVGDAENAVQAAVDLKPDVVMLDIDMPGLLSFDAADQICRLSPQTRIIFLSAYSNDIHVEQALRVKASAYVTKSQAPQVLVNAIHAVAKGGTYFSPEIRARLVVDDGKVTVNPRAKTRTALLTDRELEILRYLAEGLSKKAIAATMHLSVKTVEGHAQKVMDKLDIHDRVELTRFAIREGITRP